MPGALQRGALQPEVVVIRNGDAGGILHQDVLGLVQLLKVGSLVGNAGLLDDLPTAERVVVFHHLVVKHAGRTKQNGTAEAVPFSIFYFFFLQ